MEYRQLGRAGVKVSQLCLGTMNFGAQTSEENSHKILDCAIDQGVNFIDTANVYGSLFNRDTEPRRGWTEEIIGRWIKKNPNRRDQLVLATKVYIEMGGGPNDRGLSAYHIRRACEESLRRLRVDHIDLYQMHHVDRNVPWDEIWEVFEVLRSQGKITYVGSSNFAGWDIATACQTARRRGLFGPVSEQSKYSLAVRTIELEVIPACRHYGLGLIPWSPLAFGLLAGVLKKQRTGRRAGGIVSGGMERHRDQLQRYESLCDRIGHEPAEVGLAWVLSNPAITAPIVGPRTLEQFEGAIRAMKIELDEQTLKALDEIWPGPGGEAPEAYAW